MVSIRSASSAAIEITFTRPGSYPYRCTVAGHAALGMKGVLTVGRATSTTAKPTTTTAKPSTTVTPPTTTSASLVKLTKIGDFEGVLTWTIGLSQKRPFLDVMAEELRKDRSLPKYAQAITLYHLIVEGSLAQPGQHFIEDFFASEDSMPGFSAGMANVSRDEQRHIGFGVKVLSELFAESDECKAAASEILREVLPYVTGIFVPPNWDERYTTEYGFTMAELYAWGMRSVEQKWRATGYPLAEHPPGIYPFDPEMGYDERAERQIKLLRAGVLGAPNGKPQANHEVEEILFDVIARSAHTDAVDRPVTIQWRFEDAEPWHVRIDNGSTSSGPGLAQKPDITLRTTWADWVDVSVRGQDARRAMLRRKLKPRGSLRQLARMPKIFPPRPSPVE